LRIELLFGFGYMANDLKRWLTKNTK
jgi:hypothetical protein